MRPWAACSWVLLSSFRPRIRQNLLKNDMFKQFPYIISVIDFSWKIKVLVVISLTDLQHVDVIGE